MTALLVCVLTKTWEDRKRMGMNKKMTEHTETYKLYCTTLRTLTFNWNEPTRMREEKAAQFHMLCYADFNVVPLDGYTRASYTFFLVLCSSAENMFFPSSFNILLTLALLLHVRRLHLFTCHIRMSTVAHFFHSSFSICLVFSCSFSSWRRAKKEETMFSKSQRRLLWKVVTSFHKSFKWISWKQREKNSEWKPDLIFTSSQWYSIHQSQYLCYIQYEPRKIQIKLQKMKTQQNQS